jgi:predicted O-methyltransferase YrrM
VGNPTLADERLQQAEFQRVTMTARKILLGSFLIVLALVSATAGFLIAGTANGGAPRTTWLLLSGSMGLLALGLIAFVAALPTIRSRLLSMAKDQRRQAATLDSLEPEHLHARMETVEARLDAIRDRLIHLPDTNQMRDFNQVSADLSANAVRDQVRDAIDKTSRSIDNTARNLERSLQGVYDQMDGLASIYTTLRPTTGLPPMSRWAIGADLGAHLVRRVRETQPESIVELGGGVSTLLLALALRDVENCRIISIDHDPGFAAQTRSWLTQHGVLQHVDVVTAPLVEHEVDGEIKLWYDLAQVDLPDVIDVLLVDGPPGATGPLARLPAVPLLRERLAPDSFIVVDDANRRDERQMIALWCERYDLVVTRRLHHAKGTIELRLGTMSTTSKTSGNS